MSHLFKNLLIFIAAHPKKDKLGFSIREDVIIFSGINEIFHPNNSNEAQIIFDDFINYCDKIFIESNKINILN